jgi:hypothetical protein
MIKFGYRPLPKGITIADSPINGLGLYTKIKLLPAFVLGITHHCVEHKIIRTPLGGFINHSDLPNCQLVGNSNTFVVRTIRTIMPGEELTVHYTLEQQ